MNVVPIKYFFDTIIKNQENGICSARDLYRNLSFLKMEPHTFKKFLEIMKQRKIIDFYESDKKIYINKINVLIYALSKNIELSNLEIMDDNILVYKCDEFKNFNFLTNSDLIEGKYSKTTIYVFLNFFVLNLKLKTKLVFYYSNLYDMINKKFHLDIKKNLVDVCDFADQFSFLDKSLTQEKIMDFLCQSKKVNQEEFLYDNESASECSLYERFIQDFPEENNDDIYEGYNYFEDDGDGRLDYGYLEDLSDEEKRGYF